MRQGKCLYREVFSLYEESKMIRAPEEIFHQPALEFCQKISQRDLARYIFRCGLFGMLQQDILLKS